MAPSAIARIFGQTKSGAIAGLLLTEVPNPQSLPAITFSRPTNSAYLTMRWATSSGCSMKLVVESSPLG